MDELEMLARELVDTGAYTWAEAEEIAKEQVDRAVNEPMIEVTVLDEDLDEEIA